MARPSLPDLSPLALPGAEFAIRVTPNARRRALDLPEKPDEPIRIAVTEVPENGKATATAQEILAAALGVAKSRLTLLRGATSREKLFRLD